MKCVSVKTSSMIIYPESEAAKKYVDKDACFTMFIADHAYQRMQHRLAWLYDTRPHFGEGIKPFMERTACETCVKVLNKGIQPNAKGVATMIRHDYIWVFDFNRGTPALVTLYPYDKEFQKK